MRSRLAVSLIAAQLCRRVRVRVLYLKFRTLKRHHPEPRRGYGHRRARAIVLASQARFGASEV
jgi:hypothetical protein